MISFELMFLTIKMILNLIIPLILVNTKQGQPGGLVYFV